MIALQVAELCQDSFGIDIADIDARDHLALDIDNLGTVHFEDRGEELLVYVAREIALGADRLMQLRAALSAVHPANALPRPVQVGLRGGDLVFLCRLPARQTDRIELAETVDLLAGLHDQVRS